TIFAITFTNAGEIELRNEGCLCKRKFLSLAFFKLQGAAYKSLRGGCVHRLQIFRDHLRGKIHALVTRCEFFNEVFQQCRLINKCADMEIGSHNYKMRKAPNGYMRCS